MISIRATTGYVRAAILEALRNGRIFAPYGKGSGVSIEDLEAYGMYDPKRESVWLAGFETRVICPHSFAGASCSLPIGHTGNHKSEGAES